MAVDGRPGAVKRWVPAGSRTRVVGLNQPRRMRSAAAFQVRPGGKANSVPAAVKSGKLTDAAKGQPDRAGVPYEIFHPAARACAAASATLCSMRLQTSVQAAVSATKTAASSAARARTARRRRVGDVVKAEGKECGGSWFLRLVHSLGPVTRDREHPHGSFTIRLLRFCYRGQGFVQNSCTYGISGAQATCSGPKPACWGDRSAHAQATVYRCKYGRSG